MLWPEELKLAREVESCFVVACSSRAAAALLLNLWKWRLEGQASVALVDLRLQLQGWWRLLELLLLDECDLEET